MSAASDRSSGRVGPSLIRLDAAVEIVGGATWGVLLVEPGDPFAARAQSSSLDEVEEREEEDPHHINEVPVERARLHHVVMLCRKLAKASAVEADTEHQHTTEYVRAVESGEDVESSAERAVRNAESKLRVLVKLADQEDHSKDHRQHQRAIHPNPISTTNAPDRDLAGERADHQEECEDRRKEDVLFDEKCLVPLGWPRSGRHAEAEVRGEKTTEEHDLGNDKEEHAENGIAETLLSVTRSTVCGRTVSAHHLRCAVLRCGETHA